tara:strand:- start:787 stop:1116 length:330 start_codon:yes stop_codon:yes gene_type:complete
VFTTISEDFDVPRIGDVSQPEGPRRTEQTRRREEPARGTEQAGEASSTDRVDLSSDAQLATRMADEARQAPDVREDRIAEVKARIESGELDSDEVRGVIADRLLDQFGI